MFTNLDFFLISTSVYYVYSDLNLYLCHISFTYSIIFLTLSSKSCGFNLFSVT